MIRSRNFVLGLSCFLIGTVFNISAQETVESLLKKSGDKTLSDSVRFYAMLQVHDSIPPEQFEQRQHYLKRASEIVQKNGDLTTKVRILWLSGDDYRAVGEPRKGLEQYFIGLNRFKPQKEKYRHEYSDLCWAIMHAYWELGMSDSAYYYGMESTEFARWEGNHHGIGWRYNSLAETMYSLQRMELAIHLWKLGSQEFVKHMPVDQAGAIHGLNNSNINIAMTYSNLGLWDIAVEHVENCMEMEHLVGPYGRSWTYYILASFYGQMGESAKQINSLSKALKNIDEAIAGESQGPTMDELFRIKYTELTSLSDVYSKIGTLDSARILFDAAVKIQTEHPTLDNTPLLGSQVAYKLATGDTTGAVEICIERIKAIPNGSQYHMMFISVACNHWLNHAEFSKVITLLQPFYEEPERVSNLKQFAAICSYLSTAYAQTGNYHLAYDLRMKNAEIEDSLRTSERSLNMIKSTLEYGYKETALSDSLINAVELQERNQLIAQEEAQNANQQRTIYFISFGFILVLVLSVIAFRNARKVKKAKLIIEDQKAKVEEKNRDITDSINYARRIQNAILPARHVVRDLLPDSFILYQPKDIVAGDFYWIEKTGSEILFAVADCTGHGVPGAMVSVVCHGALTRSVREFSCTQPSEILNKTRELVIDTFDQTEENVKDGMDISLCSIDFGKMKLQFSGANNPAFIVRNNEMISINADKQPVGRFETSASFTHHSMDLEKGDCLYLFSDGYADQFGGPAGKKFKVKMLKQLLLDYHKISMSEQVALLKERFEKWKGDFSQVDDVCVFGLRIN